MNLWNARHSSAALTLLFRIAWNIVIGSLIRSHTLCLAICENRMHDVNFYQKLTIEFSLEIFKKMVLVMSKFIYRNFITTKTLNFVQCWIILCFIWQMQKRVLDMEILNLIVSSGFRELLKKKYLHAYVFSSVGKKILNLILYNNYNIL